MFQILKRHQNFPSARTRNGTPGAVQQKSFRNLGLAYNLRDSPFRWAPQRNSMLFQCRVWGLVSILITLPTLFMFSCAIPTLWTSQKYRVCVVRLNATRRYVSCARPVPFCRFVLTAFYALNCLPHPLPVLPSGHTDPPYPHKDRYFPLDTPRMAL